MTNRNYSYHKRNQHGNTVPTYTIERLEHNDDYRPGMPTIVALLFAAFLMGVVVGQLAKCAMV